MSTHNTSGSSWANSWNARPAANRPVSSWEQSFDAKPAAYRPSNWAYEGEQPSAYQPPPTQADNGSAFNSGNGGSPQTSPFNPMMGFDPNASSYQPEWLAKSPVSNPDFANLGFLDKPATMAYTPSSGMVSNFGQGLSGSVVPESGGILSDFSQWGQKNGLLDTLDSKTGIKTQGMLGAGIGAAGSIFNAYMGMKQYGLAKEQFKFNKDMTTRNFNAQAGLNNRHMDMRDATQAAAGQPGVGSKYRVGMMG